MNITFAGATMEVTGSCYLVETKKSRILVDCGMFQGNRLCDAKNFLPFTFDVKSIDAVVLTHAHLDHCGRLPKLIKDGFAGKIYCTPPTAALIEIVLEDAFQIMKEDYERLYRPMLYEMTDLEQVKNHVVPTEYDKPIVIGDIKAWLREAGHIFGSSFAVIEESGGTRATFSGDLGHANMPIVRPTAQLDSTDVLIVESTYGDRKHEEDSTRETVLKEAIETTAKQQGVLIIPAFAIERTQQLLYELNHLVENKLVPAIDIYLDSPMAIKATEVIKQYPQYYEPEALKLVSSGDDLFDFPRLHICPTRDDSKRINEAPRPKVIISGSGMMNGGRIQHHLVRYLSDARTTVLIVGYQAEGTLGSQLSRGDKSVEVLGEHVQVKAKMVHIGSYSAHADQPTIINWIRNAKSHPHRVYVTHGEVTSSQVLATKIQSELDIRTIVPKPGQTITV